MTQFNELGISPNGGITKPANLNGSSDFFKLYTVAAVAEGTWGTAASATRNYQQIIQAAGIFVNPHYLNVSTAVVDLSQSGNRSLYNLGSNFNVATTTVYTITFMAEQTGFLTPTNLGSALQAQTCNFATLAVPYNSNTTTNISAWETLDPGATNLVITSYDIS